MTERGLLLLLRRWWCTCWCCLLWVNMAAARMPAAASGQGQCEVLDLNIQSTFSLPTNLTVKPTTPGWLLDLALQEGEAPPTACVRLRETGAKVQVMLFKGDCGQGTMEKYNYLPGASVPPRAWTTLALDVKDNTVIVTASNSVSIPLKADSWSLPRDALHMTVARGVEAAVGCRVNCPLYRHASEGPDKKKTVKKSCLDDIIFYFRRGEEFVRLEYEVTCTTTEGTEEFRNITDIVPPDDLFKGMWYLMNLQHFDGEVEVRLDYKSLKKDKLPKGCTFTEHTISLVGDSHFSFSCNPSTGEVDGVVDDSWYCSTNTHSNHTPSNNTHFNNAQCSCECYTWVVVVVVVVVILVVLLIANLLAVVWLVKRVDACRPRTNRYHNHYMQLPPQSLSKLPTAS